MTKNLASQPRTARNVVSQTAAMTAVSGLTQLSVTKPPDKSRRTLPDRFRSSVDKLSKRQRKTSAKASHRPKGEEAIERFVAMHERDHEENRKIATIVGRFRPNGPNLSERLRDCGSMISLSESPATGELARCGGFFCRLWWLCPGCCRRRAARKWYQLNDAIRAIISRNRTLRVYAVTLTIRSDRDLVRNFRDFDRALDRLHKDGKNRRAGSKRGWSERASAIAGADNIEVERSEDRRWRVHSHSLWVCDREIEEERLRRDWRKASNGSFQVRVVEVHIGDDQDDDDDDLDPRLRYALKGVKYVRAPKGEQEERELSLKDRCEAFRLLRKVGGNSRDALPRMHRTFGKLRGLNVGDRDKHGRREPDKLIVLRRRNGKKYDVTTLRSDDHVT